MKIAVQLVEQALPCVSMCVCVRARVSVLGDSRPARTTGNRKSDRGHERPEKLRRSSAGAIEDSLSSSKVDSAGAVGSRRVSSYFDEKRGTPVRVKRYAPHSTVQGVGQRHTRAEYL